MEHAYPFHIKYGTCSVQKEFGKKFLIALGKQIALLRKTKGLTKLDLAVKMDNHAEQIGRIERGQLNVTICTLKKLLNRWNCF